MKYYGTFLLVTKEDEKTPNSYNHYASFSTTYGNLANKISFSDKMLKDFVDKTEINKTYKVNGCINMFSSIYTDDKGNQKISDKWWTDDIKSCELYVKKEIKKDYNPFKK